MFSNILISDKSFSNWSIWSKGKTLKISTTLNEREPEIDWNKKITPKSAEFQNRRKKNWSTQNLKEQNLKTYLNSLPVFCI